MNVYDNLNLVMKHESYAEPMRATMGSAGYDIFMSEGVNIPSKKSAKIILPFHFELNKIKNKTELIIRVFLRSSFGIKKKTRLISENNVVPFITLNLTNKEHEIEIFNDSESELIIAAGEHFAQFIVSKKTDVLQETIFESVKEEEKNKNKIFDAYVDEFEPNKFEYIIMEGIILQPNEQKAFATGLKAKIADGIWLGVYIEPTMAEYVMLANGAGVIDKDYYYADNDGHMFVGIVNKTDKEITIPRGASLLEMWSEKYYTLESEVKTDRVRTGGIGHTNQTQS